MEWIWDGFGTVVLVSDERVLYNRKTGPGGRTVIVWADREGFWSVVSSLEKVPFGWNFTIDRFCSPDFKRLFNII